MLVAPTEPKPFDVLGARNSLPETYGADFLFGISGVGMGGVQRKEVKDFVASVHDGRLSKELAQMQRLARALLVIEGQWQWTRDGEWVGSGYGPRWTRVQHRAYLLSVQDRGVWVVQSDGLVDTVEVVRGFEAWAMRTKHNGTMSRPGPRGLWGKPDDREWATHFLSGLPGVGPEIATRMFEHFGRLPIGFTVPVGELEKVPGVGKKKAAAIARCLSAMPLNGNKPG